MSGFSEISVDLFDTIGAATEGAELGRTEWDAAGGM
jgi:hypothetical protein